MNRTLFDRANQGIKSTPPINVNNSNLIFLTMLQKKDVIMYLHAIKSIYRQINEGAIIIINDGTLDDDDVGLLKKHISNFDIIRAEEVSCGQCPRGGTWERLIAAIDLSLASYVIQVDADTLCSGNIDEVIDAYKNNRGFVLGTRAGREISLCNGLKKFHNERKGGHIQTASETLLFNSDSYKEFRYVRGCSGFSGFPQAGGDRSFVEGFSSFMSESLGKRWHEWGSEQVTSNFFIANTKDAIVLPYPKYANYDPTIDIEQSVFLHFLGTHRFHKGVYSRKCKNFRSALI